MTQTATNPGADTHSDADTDAHAYSNTHAAGADAEPAIE